MNINLKLLQSFLLVAEHNSFRAAAEHANRSLPAISMQIKQLEDQLGITLFHRTTRKVELTKEGEHLLISTRRALAEIETGLLELKNAVDIQTGSITLACVPTVASTYLPTILSDFSAAYPGIVISVRELAAKQLIEAVRKREVDFGVGPKIAKMQGVAFKTIMKDDYYALMPANYRGQRKKSIALEELAKLRLLRLAVGSALREHIDTALKARMLNLESSFEMMSVTTLIAMAEAGLGIALLPKMSIPKNSSLKALRIIEPEISREVCIVSIAAMTLSPAAARLATFIERLLPQEHTHGT